MDKYCIIVNKDRDDNLTLTKRIEACLAKNGKTYVTWTENPNVEELKRMEREKVCVLVVGGDGTMIRAANQLLGVSFPIFGINAGTLGYLTGVEAADAENGLEQIFSGNYRVEKRMMLDVELNGKKTDTILNDVVISRNGFSRLINIAVYVNGSLLDVVSGDGVLVSTPTGSTGYNLSAGGAIVEPEAELMSITPICPHSLTSRGVIVSAADEIVLEVLESKRTQEKEVIVTLDGREAKQLAAHDKIRVTRSEHCTRMIKLNDGTFFEVLRRKLGVFEQ